MSEDQDLMTCGNTIRRMVIAILQYQDKFLMQLRDDIPHYSLQALSRASNCAQSSPDHVRFSVIARMSY